MYFKRMDLQGFKSFADPVSIEFHKGITCIVGPNGSGKSNISDGLRWVLGEQSPKLLRGGKMEEVIFAGTANRKSRGLAEVTLVIDNESGVLPIDYSEVEVTRKVYRSGESEYLINHSPCRLRDIRELLMDTGIGVEGYSIIGQGKIAEIVGGKAEGRREILEEAAGIVKYRSKKEESERKLEASRQNLYRVDDIVGEIESRIGGLQEDSEKAAEYLTLKERYQEIEINITLKNVEGLEQKSHLLKEDLAQQDQAIQALRQQKALLDQELSSQQERREVLEKEAAELQNFLLKKVEEINELENRRGRDQEKTASMDREQQRLTDEKQAIEGKLKREQENSQILYDKKIEMEDQLSLLQKNLEDKETLFQELSRQAQEYTDQAEALKDHMFRLHHDVSSRRMEENSLKSLWETLLQRKERLLKETHEAGEGESDAHSALDEAVQTLEQIRQATCALEKNLQKEKQQYQQNVLAEKQKAHELEELRIAAGQLTARKKLIQEMEHSYEGYQYAVKYVMQRKFSGVEGVVAELIQTPEGFETAIETALGASMQNIVCQNDTSAQAVIAELKKNRAGRLTFLPLSSLRPPSVNRNPRMSQAPGFLGYGVDCVRFDPRYQKAMEYLLARVVLVDSLNNAVALSKSFAGGFRYVTLQGEIINSGGAITGGTVKSGASNLLARKGEIRQLTAKLETLDHNQKEGVESLQSLKRHMEEGSQAAARLERELKESERALLQQENEVSLYQTQISQQEISREKRERELESIRKEEESAQSMMEEQKKLAEAAEEQVRETERKANQISAQAVEKKKLAELAAEETTKARLELGGTESEGNHLDQMIQRAKRDQKELAEERDEKELQLTRMEEEKSQMETDGKRLDVQVTQLEEQKAQLEEKKSQTEGEKLLLGRSLNETQEKRESAERTLLNHQNQKHELDLKMAKYETLMESYKDKLWQEFEVSYLQAIELKKQEFSMSEALKENRQIKTRLKELGEVNIGAIREYEQIKERYQFLTEQKNDLLSAMETLQKIIDDMDRTIRTSFQSTFAQIASNFQQTFQELFGGGVAELRLEDESRPLESNIDIVVQPPGKKLQNINLMSGGEKTMTAIALMFAVLRAKPTPFCILDEVEAALDEANIDRFARYLKNFNEIQFALITHQKATMEFADVLYGVTMAEQGVSKVLSLRLGDFLDV